MVFDIIIALASVVLGMILVECVMSFVKKSRAYHTCLSFVARYIYHFVIGTVIFIVLVLYIISKH